MAVAPVMLLSHRFWIVRCFMASLHRHCNIANKDSYHAYEAPQPRHFVHRHHSNSRVRGKSNIQLYTLPRLPRSFPHLLHLIRIQTQKIQRHKNQLLFNLNNNNYRHHLFSIPRHRFVHSLPRNATRIISLTTHCRRPPLELTIIVPIYPKINVLWHLGMSMETLMHCVPSYLQRP